MRIITDYSYLFKNMAGRSNQKQVNDIRVSQLDSRSVQSRLRAAGIDTNSAQYKAAIKEMVCSQINEANIIIYQINSVRRYFAQFGKRKIMVKYLPWRLNFPVLRTIVFEITHEFFLFVSVDITGYPAEMNSWALSFINYPSFVTMVSATE